MKMNAVNKVDPRYVIEADIEIIGDMSYFVEYVCKLYYPFSVTVCRDDEDTLAVFVESESTIHSDKFKYEVFFKNNGKFDIGYTFFSGTMSHPDTDQIEYKKRLKKEVNKVNVIHGTMRRLFASLRLFD